ncbi:hypothetical protein [Candidatus Endomicrobiellum devescovinae]|jgi:hypothetical protein|uniref:hypothetical protein n=1 Tax=Candidatus Endomicrobiellum devescovinae TaxID=3242322 RepID=UPI00282D405B|nr:hypothetical protein [Endomicrobium sp.]
MKTETLEKGKYLQDKIDKLKDMLDIYNQTYTDYKTIYVSMDKSDNSIALGKNENECRDTIVSKLNVLLEKLKLEFSKL